MEQISPLKDSKWEKTLFPKEFLRNVICAFLFYLNNAIKQWLFLLAEYNYIKANEPL